MVETAHCLVFQALHLNLAQDGFNNHIAHAEADEVDFIDATETLFIRIALELRNYGATQLIQHLVAYLEQLCVLHITVVEDHIVVLLVRAHVLHFHLQDVFKKLKIISAALVPMNEYKSP